VGSHYSNNRADDESGARPGDHCVCGTGLGNRSAMSEAYDLVNGVGSALSDWSVV